MRAITPHRAFVATITIVLSAMSALAVAKPFSLVVPSDATLGTGSPEIIVEMGYIVSTSETLTASDFEASVSVATQTGDSDYSAFIEPINVNVVAPLIPGKVGGRNFSTVLNSLLLPGETVKSPSVSFYSLYLFSLVSNKTTQTLSVSLSLGDYTASYMTILHYEPDNPVFYQVNAAQRITAVEVPEPAFTVVFPGSVMIGLLLRRRHNDCRKQKNEGR